METGNLIHDGAFKAGLGEWLGEFALLGLGKVQGSQYNSPGLVETVRQRFGGIKFNLKT